MTPMQTLQGWIMMAAPRGNGAAPGSGSMMGMFFPMILIFGLFYFMLIRPQQRRENERRKMIETLRAGQRVMFAGGIFGTIVSAGEHTFQIEITQGVVVEVARGVVNRQVDSGDSAAVVDNA